MFYRLTFATTGRIDNNDAIEQVSIHSSNNQYGRGWHTHPSFFSINSTRCIFNLLVLNFQALSCPSVLLKYALPALRAGGTYQLPQRSLATSGLVPYARDTSRTNSESVRMLVSRLWMVSVVRLREAMSCDMEGCSRWGRMRSEKRGSGILGDSLRFCDI